MALVGQPHLRVSRRIETAGQHPLQIVSPSGTRINVSVTGSSSAEAALPAGSKLIEVRSTEPVWIRFGNTGMGAAAADVDSILFPAGEKAMPVPLDGNGVAYDYVRILRAGTDDCTVQIESIPTA